jgi:HAD superfamily hydrolase (TIGR01509 family)
LTIRAQPSEGGPVGERRGILAFMERPYLLLDAGGTLVCPHVTHIRRACASRGCTVMENDLFSAFFRAIKDVDERLKSGRMVKPVDEFLGDLIVDAGAAREAAGPALTEAKGLCAPLSLWTYALPWTKAALERLRGFRMAVVSNSDGTVRRQMEELELLPYFEAVFDSEEPGVSKPDPRFFQAVLSEIRVDASECVCIGDVMMADVVGANAAGIPAIHLDPLGLYGDWPGIHAEGLEPVAADLAADTLDLADPRLKPFSRS